MRESLICLMVGWDDPFMKFMNESVGRERVKRPPSLLSYNVGIASVTLVVVVYYDFNDLIK